MNTTLEQQLASFWTMEEKDLARIHGMIGKIVNLRAECRSAAMPVNPPADPERPREGEIKSPNRPASISEPTACQRVTLGARRPMRQPKPGSLRARIYSILQRNGKPMQRADIIRAVAQQRGQPVDEVLKAKIGDALTNKHDPIFRRLAHGVYTYANE